MSLETEHIKTKEPACNEEFSPLRAGFLKSKSAALNDVLKTDAFCFLMSLLYQSLMALFAQNYYKSIKNLFRRCKTFKDKHVKLLSVPVKFLLGTNGPGHRGRPKHPA